MTDRPILFSASMVRALLDGTKTQTRRVLKPQPPGWVYPDDKPGYSCLTPKGHIEFRGRYVDDDGYDHGPASKFIKLPYGKGDRLWVRETWRAHKNWNSAKPNNISTRSRIWYDADERDNCDQHGKTRVSIHMPRWASRLTLTVTDVRVQRLKDISEEDARAEGCRAIGAEDCPDEDTRSYIWAFSELWDSINGPDAWCANPWVVAVSFDVHQCNIDQMGKQQEAA